MSRYFILLICLLAIPFLEPAVSADDAKADAELQAKIKALIERLGSDNYDEREAASGELVKIGRPAIDPLVEALRSADPEIVLRARSALSKICNGLSYEEYCEVKKLIERMRALDRFGYRAKGENPEISLIAREMGEYFPAAVPFVEELLDDARAQARFAACIVLAPLKNEKAFGKIVEFLKDSGQYYGAAGLKEGEFYKTEIAGQIVGLLRNYPLEKTTPVAEQFLRQPYLKMGILSCGDWTKKHFDIFFAFAKEGEINTSYFIKMGDKRIVPLLKEFIKNRKPKQYSQVSSSIAVLSKLAPDDAEVKQYCLEILGDKEYAYLAVNALVEIDREGAAKIFRERLGEFFKKADEAESPDFPASNMLNALAQIEPKKSIDVIEGALATRQLQSDAIRLLGGFPDDVKIQAVEKALSQFKGNKYALLTTLIHFKQQYLFSCLELESYSNARDPAAASDLAIMAQADKGDYYGYFIKNLSAISNTALQMRILPVIAAKGDVKVLPEVEKAMQNFEERHRKCLKDGYWEGTFRQQVALAVGLLTPEEVRARRRLNEAEGFERRIAADAFIVAYHLNILGKQNDAELREYLLKSDFSVPRVWSCIFNADGSLYLKFIHPTTIILEIMRKDPEEKLKKKLHEIVANILAREYLFDEKIERPKDAPALPMPPDNAYYREYWGELVKVLVKSGDKEIAKTAAALLEKNAVTATEELVMLAEAISDSDPETGRKFLRAYFKASLEKEDVNRPVWERAYRLAGSVVGMSIRDYYVPTSKQRRAITEQILSLLK